MKVWSFLFTAGLITTSFSCADSSARKTLTTNDSKGFAVVELFTSEGCSSCPRADNAAAKLLKEYGSRVYVLAYHVDYWNNLGWKDVFSNPAYTQTQKEYANAFKLSSVYTPQVVVNGTKQFVGSDEKKLNAVVEKDLQQSSDVQLDIDAQTRDNKTITVNYSTNASDAKLKIALIQSHAENKIQSGENSGATLHHVNIVRDIKTIPVAAKGNASLTVPENLNTNDCRIIAFTQNIKDNKITAAAGIKIQ